LTGNPLTGVTLTTGAIKLVSIPADGGATCPYPDSLAPKPALRAWATHIQNFGSAFTLTETASQDATLSSAEVGRLELECSGILDDGSGKGICSCGTGD
jgi:hypothetical protein